MNWLDKLFPPQIMRSKKKSVPEGVWGKCGLCGATRFSEEHEKNLRVCTTCRHHERITPDQWFGLLFDSIEESVAIGTKVGPVDFLGFEDGKRYTERISTAQGDDPTREAVVVRKGRMDGKEIVVAAFDFSFLGGSMGSVVGERFALGVDEAIALQLPFVCITSSGGARMQEGLTSLMQMGKTVACVHRLAAARLPYITVLSDPTTGGVAASLAMVADVIIAEPQARVGFAGPRVIQETVREVLPEGFQRSEFLLSHGAVDMIVDRRELRSQLCAIVAVLMHAKRRS